MNQTLLGILRGVGYPVVFAAFSAVIAAIPGVANLLPIWLPAGALTMILAAAEHQAAIMLDYNVPSSN